MFLKYIKKQIQINMFNCLNEHLYKEFEDWLLKHLYVYLQQPLFFLKDPGILISIASVLCSDGQSCPTLCNPMDYSLPGTSVHGISQARILEWVTIFFSRGSSQPRNQTKVFCIVGGLFTYWGVLFIYEKEGYPAICTKVDGPWEHYAKWDESEKDKYCMMPPMCAL